MQKDNNSGNGYLIKNIVMMIAIVLLFNFVSHKISLIVSFVWVIFLVITLRNNLNYCLPIVLISGCYERPIIDFGIGILATIKLFDLATISILFSYLIRRRSNNPFTQGLRYDKLTISLLILTIFSATSGLVNFFAHEEKFFEEARLSLYYSAKMIQYFSVFIVIYSISQTPRNVEAAINYFLFGLLLVGIFGTLQGLGIAANEYYTSETGSFSYIQKKWAISTLGPNHSHLGSYAAIGLLICLSLLQTKFSILALISAPFLLLSLFYSHSAVGTALVLIFTGLSFLHAKGTKKITIAIAGVFILIAITAYLSGTFGGSEHSRTAEKLSVDENSEIITRSFIRPIVLLSEASEQNSIGLLIGYGFRAPHLNAKTLPPTGDNNYFSVLSDIGIIGFIIFLYFLYTIYSGLKKVMQKNISHRISMICSLCHISFVGVLIAMLSQEILWPLHSRGNTFAILLIFIVMPLTLIIKRVNIAKLG